MTYLLPFDLVELLPCPATPAAGTVAPLREVAFREDAWLPKDVDALRAGFAADEDELVRRAYLRGDSLAPLQGRLGRTRTSIAYRAGELGLHGSHARPNGWRTEPAWTDDQIAVLRRDYGRVPTPELAAALGRKKAGVFNKAWSLGPVHGFIRKFDADEQRAIRVAHGAGISLTDLSKALGRDPAVVSKHAIRMGVPFATRSKGATRAAVRKARCHLGLDPGARKTCADAPSAGADVGAAPVPAIALTTHEPPAACAAIVAAMPDVPEMPQEMLVAMRRVGLLRTVAASAGLVLVTSVRQRMRL